MIKASKKMALIMAITMLFTTFATCMISTAAEAGTNLFQDGDFEIGYQSWTFTPSSGGIRCSDTATGFYIWDSAADPEGQTKIAQNRDNSLLIQPGGSAKQTISGIKPFTSYTLTYYVRTSTTAEVKIGPSIDFFNASGTNLGGAFGWPCTFAVTETPEWKKVELQFTTPNNSAVASLAPYFGNVGIEAAYLDNFSLIEDGSDPNFFLNGNFEIYNANGTPWKWYVEDGQPSQSADATVNTQYWKPEEQMYSLAKGKIRIIHDDPVQGSCVKFELAGDTSFQYIHIKQTVSLAPGNYKLSFRFKSENAAKAPTVSMLNLDGTTVDVVNFQQTVTATDSKWVNYEYYFTVKTTSNVEFRIMRNNSAGNHYIDDIALTPDTKTETVFGRAMYTPATEGCENKVGDTYIPISAVTDSPKWYGEAREIGIKTHYIPTAASEDITVLNCLYKREASGMRSLVSVSVKEYKGITAPTTVSDTINTPSAYDAIYTVESLVWDSVNGLRPILAPAVLPN